MPSGTQYAFYQYFVPTGRGIGGKCLFYRYIVPNGTNGYMATKYFATNARQMATKYFATNAGQMATKYFTTNAGQMKSAKHQKSTLTLKFN